MDIQLGGREAIFLIGFALALTLTIFVGSFVVATLAPRDPIPITFAAGESPSSISKRLFGPTAR